MRCRLCTPGLLFVCLVAIAVLAYWEFLDYRLRGVPMEYYEQHVTPDVGQAGDRLMTSWTYQVHRDCPRTIDLFVADVPVSRHRGTTRGKSNGVRTIYREITIQMCRRGNIRFAQCRNFSAIRCAAMCQRSSFRLPS